MFILGVLAFIPSCIIANLIYQNWKVRMNGKLVNAPIVDISYGKGNSGTVEIDGKRLSVYTLEDKFKVGDSIQVRYSKEKALVIQEKFSNNYFIVYFLLDGVLMLAGLLLIYGGLSKKSWD